MVAGDLIMQVSPQPLKLPTSHPHTADLGGEVDVDFVLKHRRFVDGKVGQQSPQGPQFGLPQRVGPMDDRMGTTPDQVGLMQPTTDGLATDRHLMLTPQEDDDQGTGPAANVNNARPPSYFRQ
jgi:hypothetical protein